jgi:hypothetical protein
MTKKVNGWRTCLRQCGRVQKEDAKSKKQNSEQFAAATRHHIPLFFVPIT